MTQNLGTEVEVMITEIALVVAIKVEIAVEATFIGLGTTGVERVGQREISAGGAAAPRPKQQRSSQAKATHHLHRLGVSLHQLPGSRQY